MVVSLSYAIAKLQNGIQLVAEVGKPYGIIRGTDYKYLNGQRWLMRTVITNKQIPLPISAVQPAWRGGINNTFTYKKFSLSFLVDIYQGGQVYSLDMDYGSFSGLYPRTAILNDIGIPIRLRWPGGGIILKAVTQDGKANTSRIDEDFGDGILDLWIAWRRCGSQQRVCLHASYIKLREVALSYAISR